MTEYSRLPKHIIPCHYNVYLEPNFSSFSVHGKVKIIVEVTKQTEKIVLNAKNISVSKLKLMKCDAVLENEEHFEVNPATGEGERSDGPDISKSRKRSSRKDASFSPPKSKLRRGRSDCVLQVEGANLETKSENQLVHDKLDTSEGSTFLSDGDGECENDSLKDSWSVVTTKQVIIDIKSYEVLKQEEVIIVELKEPMYPCSLLLEISFEGQLDDSMRGMYRTSHLVLGQKKWGAACHFEATGARKCFPCFDQPEFRSTYDISIVRHDPGMEALSNMPIGTINGNIVSFRRTPPLPSYLVCVVVGWYSAISQRSISGIPVSVFTPQGETAQGEYALNVAVRAIDYFKNFFSIGYTLPKMDLVAVPDFYIGAMENWGLLTFRETALLFHPSKGTQRTKEYVSILVTHEIAHQWFGNLVGIEWWDQLWLKEGFATWISFLAVEHLCPQFDIWSQFLVTERICALNLDGLSTSHPIEIPDGVQNPADIDEIFDEISYCKGASIINMLFHWIGEVDFKVGLASYLQLYKGKSATTDRLWAAIASSSSKPVVKVMEQWTKEQGFPLVLVERLDAGLYRLKQESFSSKNNQTLWIVPLKIQVKDIKGQYFMKDILLDEKYIDVDLGVPEVEWIVVNTGQTSFCRVSYSHVIVEQLCLHLNFLHVRDRVGLLSDVMALVESGREQVGLLLKLVSHCEGEEEWPVIQMILEVVEKLECLFEGTSRWSNFLQFCYKVLYPSLKKLGFAVKEGESESHSFSRSGLIQALGRLGHNDTVGQCWVLWGDEIKGRKEVHKDIQGAVYCTVGRTGKDEVIEKLMNRYNDSSSGDEKRMLGRALSCNTNPEVSQQVLDWAISDKVKLQDKTFIFAGVSASGVTGREISWQTFVKNSDSLLKMYTSGGLLKNLVKGVSNYGSSIEEAMRIEQWFSENKVEGVERTVSQVVEEIKDKSKLRERVYNEGDHIFVI